MLSPEELEEFLGRLLRRGRELQPSSEAQLQQLAQVGAQELQAKLMMASGLGEPAPQPGALEGAVNQVIKLPTPPRPKEDPDELFDPQRDLSPG
ncbi:hypothetical protein TFLX_03210 [Thermoflexales bacterium]|nr:hypothetical protein TFLX_03210 [Thermoflexales bacterium]